MVQVVIYLSNVELGGIGIQARGFAGELYKRGFGTELILLNDKNLDQERLAWYNQALPTRVLDKEILASSGARRFLSLFRVFRNTPERIVHFHSMSQEFIDWQAVVAARVAGKKVAITLHHTVNWFRYDRLGLLAQRLAWYAADCLIVTTEASKRMLGERMPVSRLEVIPCGISVPAPTKSRSQARAAFGFSEHDFVIVSAGRISKHKGFFELLQSVTLVNRDFPDVKLLIAGDGVDFRELADCARGKSFVQLTGRVENLSDVMIAGDVFAMPSFEEGFGLVYAEAACLGLASIGGRLAQVSEVIIDGETGWLVEPGNVVELTAVLSDLIKNRSKCRDAGRKAEIHCRRFAISRVVDQLQALFMRKLTSQVQ